MATLYVKTPNGTQYSMNLAYIKSDAGSKAENGWSYLPNGVIIQWGEVSTHNNYMRIITFNISYTSRDTYKVTAVAVPNSADGRMCCRVDDGETYADGTHCSFIVKSASNGNVNTWLNWMSVGY